MGFGAAFLTTSTLGRGNLACADPANAGMVGMCQGHRAGGRYTRCMRNNEVDEAPAAEPGEATAAVTPLPAPPAPMLLILASDDDAVCVDDLCLPADARS